MLGGNDENHPFLKTYLNDDLDTIDLLVDSGAQRCVINSDDLLKINKHKSLKDKIALILFKGQDNRFQSANVFGIKMLGVAILEITIKGKTMHHPFLVAEKVKANMLGADAIARFRINIDGKKCTIRPSNDDGSSIHINSMNATPLTPIANEGSLVSKRYIKVEPGHTRRILVEEKRNLKEWHAQPINVEESYAHQALYKKYNNEINKDIRPRTGCYDMKENGETYLFVSNLTSHPVDIKRVEILGVFDTLTQPPVEAYKPDEKQSDNDFESVGNNRGLTYPSVEEKEAEINKLDNKEKEAILERIWREMDIGPLNYDEPATLKDIISRNLGAFALSVDDIGSFISFSYPLKYKADANPRAAYTRPYPSSIDAQKAVSQWIERMYKAGVICRAPIDNEYQSACFVVPKKDGSKRIVVDMRKANEQLEDDFVPSKPVAHMLAEIQNSGSTIFSSVDVQHAFFSIHLTPGTEAATEFYADCGPHFTYLVMANHLVERLSLHGV